MNGQNSNVKNKIKNIKKQENNHLSKIKLLNYNKSNNNPAQSLSMQNNNQIDVLNLNSLNEEYDAYILNLKEQLSMVKQERKKTENNYQIIKHRLTLLKNQEQTININFQNIKYRFKRILNNRIQSQKKLQKSSSKKSFERSNISTSNYNNIKNYKNYFHISHTPKSSINLSRTYSNFTKKSNKKNSIDLSDKGFEKGKLKQKLIEKLKEDEEEKKRIEEEIAKIEQEEYLLLKSFKIDKFDEKELK